MKADQAMLSLVKEEAKKYQKQAGAAEPAAAPGKADGGAGAKGGGGTAGAKSSGGASAGGAAGMSGAASIANLERDPNVFTALPRSSDSLAEELKASGLKPEAFSALPTSSSSPPGNSSNGARCDRSREHSAA